MNNLARFAFLTFLIAILVACGDGTSGSSNNSSSGTTSYSYVVPQINGQRIYSRTIIDNSSNTINETLRETVTAVNPDGSFVSTEDDPTHTSITINGTTYTIDTATVTDTSSGQELSYVYTPSGESLTTCLDNPHGLGPDYPLLIGTGWSITYTWTCGASPPILYSQTGSVIDLESVTVPAGTFSALKLQSTVSWTDSQGTTFIETITNWRDANTGRSVKEVTSRTFNGPAPTNGYAVSSTTELQSQS